MSIKMGFGTPPTTVITKHTELTDKETAGVIDHANLSVTDGKLASGVGLSDGQILKLPTAAADKVLKRGAAAWEAGDVVLEGDYSDWTIYDSFIDDMVSGGDCRQFGVWNKEETIIMLFSPWRTVVKRYAIATKVLTTFTDYEITVYDTPEATFKSVLGTYYLARKRDSAGIGIWKNGELIKSFTASELGLDVNTVYSVSISPSGKYIAVSGWLTPAGLGWVVLVGS